MMRSLFAGVSGLRSHQTRMDVIGNNIANVNTVGYKNEPGHVSRHAVPDDAIRVGSDGAAAAASTRCKSVLG